MNLQLDRIDNSTVGHYDERLRKHGEHKSRIWENCTNTECPPCLKYTICFNNALFKESYTISLSISFSLVLRFYLYLSIHLLFQQLNFYFVLFKCYPVLNHTDQITGNLCFIYGHKVTFFKLLSLEFWLHSLRSCLLQFC